MKSVSRKYKQFWFFIIKLSFIIGAGYYIYKRTFYNTAISIEVLTNQVKTFLFKDYWIVPMLLFFTLLNWFFEVLKWQSLVQNLHKISFVTALKQSLSAHTLSIVTPFKSGEYVGKALFFEKKIRKKIILLNLVGNLAQLGATLFFGIVGLAFFLTHFEVPIPYYKVRRLVYLVGSIITFFIIGNQALKKTRWSYYQKAYAFYKGIAISSKVNVLLFSVLRYIIFSHQFYLLLLLFGINVTYSTAMFLIFSMYFIATILPVMSLLDFVIKGSIAIYLFTFVGSDELKILLVSTLMWLLNFVFPAVIGAVYILFYQNKHINIAKPLVTFQNQL